MEDPSYYLSFWGKSRTLDDGILSHPAAFHMLDVAAVARAWLRANRSFIPGLGPWREDYLPTILVLVALHDIGKFSRPFQAKLKDLWPTSLGAYEARPQPHHGLAGYDLLQLHPFEDRLAPLFPELGRVDKACLWRSICGHHGRPPSDSDIVDTRTYCPPSKKAALAFLDDLLALLKPEPLKINFDEVIGFSWWLAGLTVLSDWIGCSPPTRG